MASDPPPTHHVLPHPDTGSAQTDTAHPSVLRAEMRPEALRTFTFPRACAVGVPFCEQAKAAGLWALPPAYGRGTTILDVDEDGLDDIWQGHAGNSHHLGSARTGTLWRNLGDGTFAPLPLGIAPAHMTSTWGGIWADIDNDGDQDLLLVNGGFDGPGVLALYQNDLATAGAFTDVTQAAGITQEPHPWWGASFADFDRDGWLDVVITARAERVVPPCCAQLTVAPDAPAVAPVLLYRNRGDGRFDDVTVEFGLTALPLDVKNPVWWDYDRDGWPDLFVANFTAGDEVDAGVPTVRLYRNQAGRAFSDVTDKVLPSLVSSQGGVFVAAVTDIDQDGWDDLYVGRNAQQDVILRNRGDGTFDILGGEIGLDMSPRRGDMIENTMGLNVGDLTGDGLPDIFVGPGWPLARGLALPYRNVSEPGRVRVVRMTSQVEGNRIGFHHGTALGDLDQDGDVDAYWNLGGFGRFDQDPSAFSDEALPEDLMDPDSREQAMLLVNHGGSTGRTALVRLRGTLSNRDAVGARLTILGSSTRYAAVPTTTGFQSRNSTWMTLAFGTAERARVIIDWPSGLRTENTIAAGSRVWLVEPGAAPGMR